MCDKKRLRCAQNTRELPVTEERFDLNNNPEVFCHLQMTMTIILFSLHMRLMENDSLKAVTMSPKRRAAEYS